MTILVDGDSRIIIQGITGYNGRNAAGRMLEGGTPLVGGVTPGRGGAQVRGLPVFESCAEAVRAAGANASFVSVPAPFLLDACLEAIDAGIKVLSVYTEGAAITDSIQIAAHARARGVVVLGPNSAGCVSPGLANLSDLNDANLDSGRVGIVSKSGTLTYEVIDGLRRQGLGESTVVCLGGDPVTGSDHGSILRRFEADLGTDAVVLIGEIGGGSELAAAKMVAGMAKPVVAFIAGRAAPPGKRMGHAGALLRGGRETTDESAAAKIAALAEAGATVAESIVEVAPLVRERLPVEAPHLEQIRVE
jgi:succinyl-CoA synthetase alpha subunit